MTPPTLPLPGSTPAPSTTSTTPTAPLDPDEVGYSQPSQEAIRRGQALSHTPETCQREHCGCHLPLVFNPPNLELTSREALVLAWHLFPLRDDEELSFEEIGAKLGVTPTRVKQIYQRAGAKLRAYPRVHYPENTKRKRSVSGSEKGADTP